MRAEKAAARTLKKVCCKAFRHTNIDPCSRRCQPDADDSSRGISGSRNSHEAPCAARSVSKAQSISSPSAAMCCRALARWLCGLCGPSRARPATKEDVESQERLLAGQRSSSATGVADAAAHDVHAPALAPASPDAPTTLIVMRHGHRSAGSSSSSVGSAQHAHACLAHTAARATGSPSLQQAAVRQPSMLSCPRLPACNLVATHTPGKTRRIRSGTRLRRGPGTRRCRSRASCR